MGSVSDPGYPQAWEADVLLRDGHPIHLRPITPDDGDALRAFHACLSARTVYFRFFSAKPELTDADVEYFTHVDHESRVALVALDRDDIIGVGRFDALGDGRAEVAFLIRDDMQGLGLGSMLLEHLAAAARERGVARFVAEVLPANSRMLSTFREAGYVLTQQREDDVIAVGFDIEPTAASLAVMSAREHRAEARSMERMLRPQSVAVVGASRDRHGLGSLILRNLVDGGFRGRLVAVHRGGRARSSGVPCVGSLAERRRTGRPRGGGRPGGGGARRARRCRRRRRSTASSSCRAASELQGQHWSRRCTGTGMRLVGPNALGLINTDPEVRLNASLVPAMPARGRVGFFCQSGALGQLDPRAVRRSGASASRPSCRPATAPTSPATTSCSTGRRIPRTDLVLLHLESIGNARKFARLVHRLARSKPVVMVRSGGAEQAHPLGHAVARNGPLPAGGRPGPRRLRPDRRRQRRPDDRRRPASPSARRCRPTDGVAVIGNSDALAVLAVNAIARNGLAPARQRP